MYPAFAKAIYLDASGCATHVPIGEAYDVHSRALNWRLPYVCVRCIQILEALRGPWPVSWRGGIPAASTTRSLKVRTLLVAGAAASVAVAVLTTTYL